MKNIGILSLISLFLWTNVKSQEQTWKTIPYYLKGYETEYAESPKKAALAWFKDARFGLFVHCRLLLFMKKGSG